MSDNGGWSKPVISNHLEKEDRFRTPDLLVRFNIRRAMNVILQGNGKAYGVLEVDSQLDYEFEEHDRHRLLKRSNRNYVVAVAGLAKSERRDRER
jgi:hypothetical protein